MHERHQPQGLLPDIAFVADGVHREPPDFRRVFHEPAGLEIIVAAFDGRRLFEPLHAGGARVQRQTGGGMRGHA